MQFTNGVKRARRLNTATLLLSSQNFQSHLDRQKPFIDWLRWGKRTGHPRPHVVEYRLHVSSSYRTETRKWPGLNGDDKDTALGHPFLFFKDEGKTKARPL